MRSWIHGLVLTLGMFLLAGCQMVTNTSPVGMPSPDIASDLEGVWRAGEAVLHVKASSTPGQLTMAHVQWDGQKMHIKQQVVHVGLVGEDRIISLQPEESKEKEYAFALLIYSGGSPDAITVLMPRFDAFEKAVKQGRLKALAGSEPAQEEGTQQSRHLRLDLTPEQWASFLKDQSAGGLFDLKHPLVISRIPGVKVQDGPVEASAEAAK